MKFKLEIDCDNAAFQPNPDFEVARILKEAARQMEVFSIRKPKLYDSNGNHVGFGLWYSEPTQDIRDEIEQRR